MQPKISIVIAVYNGASHLTGSLKSILSQDYPNYEIIVIDGGSKDKTVDIIKQYEPMLSYWVSERDKGIYDAWNKGIAKATGDWIMFLGSDDLLMPGALRAYVDSIKLLPADIQYISSRMQMTDAELKPIRVKGWPWEWPRFLKDVTVAHPGSLHARSLFGQYGNFDISYRIVGDYEFLLRPGGDLKAAFLDKITVIMREGGASDSAAAIHEHYRACVETGGQSVASAMRNRLLVSSKFHTRQALRHFGWNVYLKR